MLILPLLLSLAVTGAAQSCDGAQCDADEGSLMQLDMLKHRARKARQLQVGTVYHGEITRPGRPIYDLGDDSNIRIFLHVTGPREGVMGEVGDENGSPQKVKIKYDPRQAKDGEWEMIYSSRGIDAAHEEVKGTNVVSDVFLNDAETGFAGNFTKTGAIQGRYFHAIANSTKMTGGYFLLTPDRESTDGQSHHRDPNL
eukprot:gnl/TRDRNA2_/TRDRNA2_183424_c0_seq1.p1 gnl/TRDRNA2_/TRDRNA2_183424_c0~~gnl/TRDRNA2_/TRDRNA2_183424_c0_seq1.p1  ORF type:complete len:198 (+),score=29.29 gnl/TRDRNA2_/TRDRNA2_183424_c0_seq1:77-670(+)